MKRVAQNRLKAAASRSGLARAEIANAADFTAQALVGTMETLLVSNDVDEDDLDDESAKKAFMTHHELESSVNHRVHFDFLVQSIEYGADLDSDLDLPENF